MFVDEMVQRNVALESHGNSDLEPEERQPMPKREIESAGLVTS